MIARVLSITAFLMLCLATSAWADYIQGHVVQLDRQQGTVDIILCATCAEGKECSKDTEAHLAEHGPNPATVRVRVDWLPRCLAPGMMVYARGVYAEDDATRFEAVEVFPRKRLGSKDNTGVRSRFRHQRGRGHRQGQHE